MTLTEAQTALDALDTAIHAGVLTVERGGRRITYQSQEQMRAEASRLLRDIQRAQSRPSIQVATWSGTK